MIKENKMTIKKIVFRGKLKQLRNLFNYLIENGQGNDETYGTIEINPDKEGNSVELNIVDKDMDKYEDSDSDDDEWWC